MINSMFTAHRLYEWRNDSEDDLRILKIIYIPIVPLFTVTIEKDRASIH